MIREHPLLGIGPGKKNFRDAFQLYGGKIKEAEKQIKKEKASEQPKKIKIKKKNAVKGVEKLSSAHNILLHIWVEIGIVGLLAFLWLFVTGFSAAIKSWWSLKSGYEKELLLGNTASLISIFSHGLTDSFWKKSK